MEHGDRADRGLSSTDLPTVFEQSDSDEFDTKTEFTKQFLTIWSWNTKLSTIGVHNHCFGVLEIPEYPEIKGIRVGIMCEQLWRNWALELTTSILTTVILAAQ